MLKNRKCQYCDKEFENIEGRVFSNHVKWCKNNPNSSYNKTKCLECGELIPGISISLHKCKQKKICLFCNKEFVDLYGESKFCSQSCSAGFNNKERMKNGKSSKGFKYKIIERNCKCGSKFSIAENQHSIIECDKCRRIEYIGKRKFIIMNTTCVICGKDLTYGKGQKVKKTCSRECYSKLMSNNAKQNINCGGETNYKRYVYNGISMDSTWEVEVAKLIDSLNIKWDRSKKLCLWWYDDKNNKRRYHPDFYLPNFDVFLDTKNKYLMEQDKYKIQKVLENNKVNLIVGSLEVVKNYILKLVNPT